MWWLRARREPGVALCRVGIKGKGWGCRWRDQRMFNHPLILLRLYAAALSDGREDNIQVSDSDV